MTGVSVRRRPMSPGGSGMPPPLSWPKRLSGHFQDPRLAVQGQHHQVNNTVQGWSTPVFTTRSYSRASAGFLWCSDIRKLARSRSLVSIRNSGRLHNPALLAASHSRSAARWARLSYVQHVWPPREEHLPSAPHDNGVPSLDRTLDNRSSRFVVSGRSMAGPQPAWERQRPRDHTKSWRMRDASVSVCSSCASASCSLTLTLAPRPPQLHGLPGATRGGRPSDWPPRHLHSRIRVISSLRSCGLSKIARR